MCRNHSHITTEITGVLLLENTRLVEMRVIHPLAVQMPYGEKWTKPPGSTLYLPVSMCDPLPASPRRLMEVSYIPSFYMGGIDSTIGPEHPTTPLSAGSYGDRRFDAGEP